jgi:2-polyprenyl-3-methyl-5-hydroxy-6-metoxy-1,4-benzoquinol methylase
MQNLQSCPLCASTSFSQFLSCKDFTVSHEIFRIVQCDSCGFRFTNPRPHEQDLGRYYKSESYVSHTSSRKGLINFLYNIVRKITLRQKMRLIKRIVKGRMLLDFGCGTGHFLAQAGREGFVIKGIEPDPDARRLAKDLNNIEPGTRDDLNSLSDRFDLITLWHVLEHLPDLNGDIESFKRLLKDDGRLLIAVPNCSSYDAEIYKEFWAGYDVPRHLYHFTPETITKLFRAHGLDLLETLPMKFDAYYVSMLSEKYRGGGMLKGVMNGLRSNRRARQKNTFSSQIYIFKRSN